MDVIMDHHRKALYYCFKKNGFCINDEVDVQELKGLSSFFMIPEGFCSSLDRKNMIKRAGLNPPL